MRLGIDIGLKNFAYCLMNENQTIVEWDVFDLSSKVNEREHYKGKFDMIHVSLNIFKLFRNLVEVHGDPSGWTVRIENQIPRGANGITMKSIQGMATQQLTSMGVIDITYVSGSCKLKDFDVPKKTYSERKASSIAVTVAELSGKDALLKLKKGKKDDMCDAYLLCRTGNSASFC